MVGNVIGEMNSPLHTRGAQGLHKVQCLVWLFLLFLFLRKDEIQ